MLDGHSRNKQPPHARGLFRVRRIIRNYEGGQVLDKIWNSRTMSSQYIVNGTYIFRNERKKNKEMTCRCEFAKSNVKCQFGTLSFLVAACIAQNNITTRQQSLNPRLTKRPCSNQNRAAPYTNKKEVSSRSILRVALACHDWYASLGTLNLKQTSLALIYTSPGHQYNRVTCCNPLSGKQKKITNNSQTITNSLVNEPVWKGAVRSF